MLEKTEIKKNGEQAIAYLGEYIYNARNSRLYKSMCDYGRWSYDNGLRDGISIGYKEGFIAGSVLTITCLGLTGLYLVKEKKKAEKIRVYE